MQIIHGRFAVGLSMTQIIYFIFLVFLDNSLATHGLQ